MISAPEVEMHDEERDLDDLSPQELTQWKREHEGAVQVHLHVVEAEDRLQVQVVRDLEGVRSRLSERARTLRLLLSEVEAQVVEIDQRLERVQVAAVDRSAAITELKRRATMEDPASLDNHSAVMLAIERANNPDGLDIPSIRAVLGEWGHKLALDVANPAKSIANVLSRLTAEGRVLRADRGRYKIPAGLATI